MTLNPLTDSSSGKTNISYRGLKEVKKRVVRDAVDKDFTTADISNSILSDHLPVISKFLIPKTLKAEFTWRLNELHTESRKQQIQTWIDLTLQTNNVAETSPATIWETMKCVLKCRLIALGSKLKKEKDKEISTLVKEITALEQSHKENIAQKTLVTLESKRLQLRAPEST
ncbi:hypothetical protein XELAEV_18018821mg [Xenopus laevis]|uniref:Uncharacterized protein n=1 Tax=Xenopus laevis TaxID=8355 RepID=A0A974DEH3_XENLA|nr:hypothetical protein XELAEV_18018821mg [Xenopus laevis]